MRPGWGVFPEPQKKQSKSMKKLKNLCTAAAAFGLAAQVQAGYYAGSTDFEGANPLGEALWSAVGDATIATDASVTGASSRPENLPSTFSNNRTNVLVIDNDEPIVRNLGQNDGATPGSIYADVLVKGTALAYGADAPTNSLTGTDKLLVYFRVNESGNATNVCVFAKGNANSAAGQEFVLTQPATSIGKDEWHRIVIAATAEGTYQLYLDGHDSANLCKTAGNQDTFYSLSSGTVSGIGFAGTGSVDDLVLSTFTPALPVSTLTWDTAFASVSYVVGNETNTLTAAGGSCQFQAPSGASVTLIGDTGYRTVTATGTASSSPLTLEVAAPTGLAWYSADVSGSGTENDPYLIPTYGALVAMQQAVAASNVFRSAYYEQTADIDFTGKPEFAGIGTYNVTVEDGIAFTGTYDGGSHKISNVTMTTRNYGGIFNQVNGGTIKDLTVENLSGKSVSIVGHAANGATLQRLAATGTFCSAESPATHNAAGIVVRVGGGATSGTVTTIQSCTNNATIYGTYSKIGGIAAIVQGSDASKKSGKVVFDGCVNNGSIHRIGNETDTNGGFGGILAYATFPTEIENCVNNGTIDATLADAHIGQIVGHYQGSGLSDLGGNSGSSSSALLGKIVTTGNLSGFQFATIDTGVATTVSGALQDGETYLLERNVASGTVHTLDATGDTIAFDTALGYTFAGTVASGVEHYSVADSTSGTVTTYSLAIDQFNVTFVDEDGTTVLKAATAYDYGTLAANVVAPEDPTKAATAQYAYTFAGWSPAIADVTADATYTATYSSTVNKYTVSWDANGGSLSGDYTSGSVDYGTAIVAPTATKAATVDKTFAFAGWTPAVDATVTSNATYTATWNEAARTYTITWTDHSGTVKTETLASGATPTAPETAPVSYTENGNIYTGTWPTPADVTGDATYAAVYTSVPAKAMVISVAGTTTNFYPTVAAAVDAAGNGDTVKLLADATVTSTLVIPANTAITLDLGGRTLTSTASPDAIFNYGTLVLQGGTINASASLVRNLGSVTVESGTYTANGNGIMCGIADKSVAAPTATGCSVTINGGTITSVEMAVCTGRTADGTITVNGGTLTSTDNAVIGDNGTAGCGGNVFSVSNATLTASITSAGYVACGIYICNDDTLTVEDTVINVTGGAGIVARAGDVTIGDGTVVNTTGTAVGKVGDSRVVVPCAAVVFDSEANYPGYQTGGADLAIEGGTFVSAGTNAVVLVGTDDTVIGIDPTGSAVFSDAASDGVPAGYELVEVEGSDPVMYQVSASAGIQYYNTWSVPNIYYFDDEDPIPARTTQGTVPKIRRFGESTYHVAEDWVEMTWTVTASTATNTAVSDNSIATVSSSGLVTFTQPGTVKVWLTMTDPSGASKSSSKTVKYEAAPAYVVSADGNTKTAYGSLYAAFNAAKTGEKVVLGKDASVNNIGKVEIKDGRDLTFDLNGHTVSFSQNYREDAFGALFSIENGSLEVVDTGVTKGGIVASGTNARAFSLDGTGNDSASDAVLTIGEGVNVSSALDCCVTLFGKSTLNTAGNLTSTNDFAIAGSGKAAYAGTVINVTGGTITGDEIAIYQPQDGVLDISGGTIIGDTAVYVKAGTVSISGGTLVGNGAQASYSFNGSGANATGDALVVDNCGYTSSAPVVTITGGTFVSENGQSVSSHAKSDDPSYADSGYTAVSNMIPAVVNGEPNPARFSDAEADGVPEGYELVETESGSGVYQIAIKTFTVTWVSDGATIATYTDVPYGTTTNYVGATPTKVEDASYTYAFDTWTPAVGPVTNDTTYTAVFNATEKPTATPTVDAGTGLDDYNAAHPGEEVKPIAIDATGFTLSFVAPADGTYVLFTATDVTGTFTETEITQEAKAGDLVQLKDEAVSGAKKFYKIGWEQ